MRTLTTAVLLGSIGLSQAGCGASSARKAVDTAEREIAAIRDEAAKIAPDRLQSLTDSLEAIKARLDSGESRSALMSARSLTSLARDLSASLPNTKSQLETAFKSASEEVPPALQQVLARIEELGSQRRLPPTIDAARFSTLRTESAGWSATWEQAQQDFADGNTALAMQKANDLRGKIRNARSTLGMDS
jgi:hypothetical protein